ncbi:hypothetical protein [Thermopirellula anaerolimosa]
MPAAGLRVVNPRNRHIVSLIIDDSTCLVNLAHFAMPQFAEVWPNREEYKKPWRTMPREIPDAFVARFIDWCELHDVKGKYSLVPYPACVGWLDRDLPGWERNELTASLDLVRKRVAPRFDIHPEMVTHTWVIDTKTGRPYPERSVRFMENWNWTDSKSVDELADYMAYALRILKNVDMPCEGITTPGGFGNRVLPQLARAALKACRDVFSAEIPHYFRHVFTDDRSVSPRVEYASGIDGHDATCVVSIIGCTDDRFGGWDGMTPGDADYFITNSLDRGRMVEVLERGEPAVMVCHWPGIYYNGQELGFKILKDVVQRLESRFETLLWMKLSELARYWAAKELTQIAWEQESVVFRAPFAAPDFTVSVAGETSAELSGGLRGAGLRTEAGHVVFSQVFHAKELRAGTFLRDQHETLVCFDLPKGDSRLVFHEPSVGN